MVIIKLQIFGTRLKKSIQANVIEFSVQAILIIEIKFMQIEVPQLTSKCVILTCAHQIIPSHSNSPPQDVHFHCSLTSSINLFGRMYKL